MLRLQVQYIGSVLRQVLSFVSVLPVQYSLCSGLYLHINRPLVQDTSIIPNY